MLKDNVRGVLGELCGFLSFSPVHWQLWMSAEELCARQHAADLHDCVDAKLMRRATDHMIIPCDGSHNLQMPLGHIAYLGVWALNYPPKPGELWRFELSGWMYGDEIRKRYKIVERYHRGKFRYGRWVPREDLHDPAELFDMVRKAQRDRPMQPTHVDFRESP